MNKGKKSISIYISRYNVYYLAYLTEYSLTRTQILFRDQRFDFIEMLLVEYYAESATESQSARRVYHYIRYMCIVQSAAQL